MILKKNALIPLMEFFNLQGKQPNQKRNENSIIRRNINEGISKIRFSTASLTSEQIHTYFLQKNITKKMKDNTSCRGLNNWQIVYSEYE